MKGCDATVMGVASIVAHPLNSDILGTARSALVISRVKQLFQLSRQGTRDVMTMQQQTHVFWAHQCLSNTPSI
jgi:hypothetical protein